MIDDRFAQRLIHAVTPQFLKHRRRRADARQDQPVCRRQCFRRRDKHRLLADRLERVHHRENIPGTEINNAERHIRSGYLVVLRHIADDPAPFVIIMEFRLHPGSANFIQRRHYVRCDRML